MSPHRWVPGWTVVMLVAFVSGCVSTPPVDDRRLEERVASLERAVSHEISAIAAFARREEESRGQISGLLERIETAEGAQTQAQVAFADFRERLASQTVEIQGREKTTLTERIESLDRSIESLETEKRALVRILEALAPKSPEVVRNEEP